MAKNTDNKIGDNALSETNNILEKYFYIEGKHATLDLYYDTFSELIDNNFGNDKIEKLNSVLFDEIEETVKLLPSDYKLKIKIHINDFGSYTSKEALKIIRENFELYFYGVLQDAKRKKRNGLLAVATGVVLLLVSYFMQKTSIPYIFQDVMNISGTLFVWEGIGIAFMERNQEIRSTVKFAEQIESIDID